MKPLLSVVFLLLALSSWAAESPRQLALAQFPVEVRELLGKNITEARKVLKDVPQNKRREDERGLFVNLLGVNFDVTLGKKADAVDWLALRSPPQRSLGLYEKLLEKFGKQAKIKNVDVGGPAPGQYIELSFPTEGIQFRFVSASKDLYSIVVQRKP